MSASVDQVCKNEVPFHKYVVVMSLATLRFNSMYYCMISPLRLMVSFFLFIIADSTRVAV